MGDWVWVPWILTGLFGVTAAYLTLRGQMHTKSTHWLSLASKETESVRAEVKSEIGGVRSDVAGVRNEVAALISAGKSETLLAVSNAKIDVLQAIAAEDGKLQRVETTLEHVQEQVKDLKTDLGWAVDQIKQSVASASSMGRSTPGTGGVPQPRRVGEENQTEKT